MLKGTELATSTAFKILNNKASSNALFFFLKQQLVFLLIQNIMSLRSVPFHQYWVSQGNKWCDFCKIYIANNPQSIRTHELGQRHKDNVANRIAAIRKENASKEKEQKEAMRVMQQIEARAMRSYQKDLASFKETQNSKAGASNAHDEIPETAKPASRDGNI